MSGLWTYDLGVGSGCGFVSEVAAAWRRQGYGKRISMMTSNYSISLSGGNQVDGLAPDLEFDQL